MTRTVGSPIEFQEMMESIFQTCVAGLTDKVGNNDSRSFRLLAKVLSCVAGLARDAQIALSCQYSITDPGFEHHDEEYSNEEKEEAEKEKREEEGKVGEDRDEEEGREEEEDDDDDDEEREEEEDLCTPTIGIRQRFSFDEEEEVLCIPAVGNQGCSSQGEEEEEAHEDTERNAAKRAYIIEYLSRNRGSMAEVTIKAHTVQRWERQLSNLTAESASPLKNRL